MWHFCRCILSIAPPHHFSKQRLSSLCHHRYHIHPSRRVVAIYTASLHRGFLLSRKRFLTIKCCPVHNLRYKSTTFSSTSYFNSKRIRIFATCSIETRHFFAHSPHELRPQKVNEQTIYMRLAYMRRLPIVDSRLSQTCVAYGEGLRIFVSANLVLNHLKKTTITN